MRHFPLFFRLAFCTLALGLSARAVAEVVVIPLRGEISEAQFFFLRRAVKEAEQTKANAVVIDMDTYGGSLAAAVEMLDALSKTSVSTFAYINSNAGSAGALVSLATKHIYMAPVSAIGAAAPVAGGGEELGATMHDKIVSYFSGYFRSAAERNGYNPSIAEAFIDKTKEVKLGETQVHAKGTLLTFSSQEAVKVVEGKPLLAEGVVSSIDELISKAHLQGPFRRIEPTGVEKLAFWITGFAPVLLMLGMVGAYLEVKLHGTFIPGAFAAVCFLLFFFGHYVAGLAGWEVGAIFGSELIIHPGTIIPGLLGVLLMIAALLWAMTDHYPSQPFLPTSKMLVRPVLNLGVAVVASAVAIAILGKYLPRTPLFRWIILGQTNAPGTSLSAQHVGSPVRLRVGENGVATSMLRPSGKADFAGEVMDVITLGSYVSSGAKVRVIEVAGSRVVVEELL